MHPSSAGLCPTASSFPGPEPATGRPPGPSPERRSRRARPRPPGVLENASSQLPRIRPRHARPEGALGRPRGCTGPPGRAGPGGTASGGADRGRPHGSLRLTVCSCSSDRARGSSSSNNAAAAATPGAPGSGLILRAPTGRAPAHRLLRRRRRFTSTGRGQTHGARAQPLPPPPSPPAPRRPRPPASEPLPLTQPRHPATPAHAGSPPDAGPQPPPARAGRGAGWRVPEPVCCRPLSFGLSSRAFQPKAPAAGGPTPAGL